MFAGACSDSLFDKQGASTSRDVTHNGTLKGDASENAEDFDPHPVIVNEFMVKQDGVLADPDFGAYSGWIELYNPEFEEVDISNWIIAGEYPGADAALVDTIPAGTVIPPDAYLLIWADGNHIDDGEAIHLGFNLSEQGGKVGLYGPEYAGLPVMDTISYGKLDVDPHISIGRTHFSDFGTPKQFVVPMNQPTPGNRNRIEQLTLRDYHELDIQDPSGLSPDYSGNGFWTVSDIRGGSIYRITRDGHVLEELAVDGHDMEGITQDPETLSLFVAEERRREVVVYQTTGQELNRYEVDIEVGDLNNGLEGIAINPSNGHIFVVNKRNPRVLLELELLSDGTTRQIQRQPINFGAPEDAPGLSLSGLFYDEQEQLLWMISDEAEAVFVLDTTGRLLAVFEASHRDLESIALIGPECAIYATSDQDQRLYEYECPSPLRRLPADRSQVPTSAY